MSNKDEGLALDMCFIDQLWTIYRTDPTVGSCANMLRTRLLGLGIMYMYGEASAPRAPRREFYEFVSRKYSDFARDAMEHLIVMGFCAYVIAPAKKRGEIPYPVAIPFGKASFSIRYDTFYQPSMYVSSSSNSDKGLLFANVKDEGDTRALFIVSTYPDTHGRVTSPVAQVYAIQAMKRQMEANVLFADRVRARPPVMTQTSSAKFHGEHDFVGLGEVDGDMGAALERKNLLRKNQIGLEVWAQQSALVGAMNSGQNGGQTLTPFKAKQDPLTKLPFYTMDGDEPYTPTFIPLPADTTAATMQLPVRMTDFIEMEKLISQQTAICMGVNPQALMGSTGATSGLAELADSTIAFTIMRYRSALANGLVDIYDIIHSKAVGKRTQSNVTVVFPSAQRPELLTRLVGIGVLSYEYYIHEMATFYSIPEAAFQLQNAIPPPPQQQASERRF
jgi:hypothetical protein